MKGSGEKKPGRNALGSGREVVRGISPDFDICAQSIRFPSFTVLASREGRDDPQKTRERNSVVAKARHRISRARGKDDPSTLFMIQVAVVPFDARVLANVIHEGAPRSLEKTLCTNNQHFILLLAR